MQRQTPHVAAAVGGDVLSVLLRGTRLRRGSLNATSSASSKCKFATQTVDKDVDIPVRKAQQIHGFENSSRVTVAADTSGEGDPLDFFGYTRSRSSGTSHRENITVKASQPLKKIASHSSLQQQKKAAAASSSAKKVDNSVPSSSDNCIDSKKSGTSFSCSLSGAAALRRRYCIHVKASDSSHTIPKPFESFRESVFFFAEAVGSTRLLRAADAVDGRQPKKVRRRRSESFTEKRISDEAHAEENDATCCAIVAEKGTRAAVRVAGARRSNAAQETENSKAISSIRKLPAWLLSKLEERGITKPTPIQMQAIPLLLQGENLLASAPTGSGKTLAFLLPIIALLRKPRTTAGCRLLVVCPTRELAKQTSHIFSDFAGSRGFQCSDLDEFNGKGEKRLVDADAVVATPLKLVQLLREKKVSLAFCVHVVIDEADKLLDNAFAPQLDEILSRCKHSSLQICLFSATLTSNVTELANAFLHCPVRVSIGVPNAAATNIDQDLIFCTSEEGKRLALKTLHLNGKLLPPALIFVQSKERAQQLFCELMYDGLLVECIHAGKSKQQRDSIVEAFLKGQIWILICTDMMSRGVDFTNVNLVISYDFPDTPAAYIHRIGRTGRAARQGRAITFYTIADIPYLRNVVGVLQQTPSISVPSWLREVSKFTSRRGKRVKRHPPPRKPIFSTAERRRRRGQVVSQKPRKKQSTLEVQRCSEKAILAMSSERAKC